MRGLPGPRLNQVLPPAKSSVISSGIFPHVLARASSIIICRQEVPECAPFGYVRDWSLFMGEGGGGSNVGEHQTFSGG